MFNRSDKEIAFSGQSLADLLFAGIPNSYIHFHNGCIDYREVLLRNSLRVLSKKEYEKRVDCEIVIIKQSLKLRGIDINSDNCESVVRKSKKKDMEVAYRYFYWTKKSSPKMSAFVKKQNWFVELPHIKVEGECEACFKKMFYKFGKQGRTSKTRCDSCGHVPETTCMCLECTKLSKVIISNVKAAVNFVNNWTDRNIKKIRALDNQNLSDTITSGEVKNLIIEYVWSQSRSEVSADNSHVWGYPIDSLHNRKEETPVRIHYVSVIDSRFSNENLRQVFKKQLLPTENSLKTKLEQESQSGPLSILKKGFKNIYVLTTSPNSKGYCDFCAVTANNVEHTPVFFRGDDPDGLWKAISGLGVKGGDFIVIVRGGGDISHPSFKSLNSSRAVDAIKAARLLGCTVISGIGHADDNFAIDQHSSMSEITPTRAGDRLLELLSMQSNP